MKKLKKFIYPFIFLAAFVAFNVLLITIINAASGNGFGGIAVFVFSAIVQLVIIAPVYCVFYSNIIKDEKHNFLFAVYNAVVLGVPLFFFGLYSDGLIITFIYILWAGLWSCARFKKDMQDDDDY